MKKIKVKLLVSRSGEEGAFSPGDEIYVPENEVQPMLAAGQCIVVDAAPPARKAKVETAVPDVSSEKAAG